MLFKKPEKKVDGVAREVTDGPRVVRRMLAHLKLYRPEFAGALGCMVLYGATDGLIPLLLKYVLDGVFANPSEKLLLTLPIFVVFFACIRAASDFGQSYLMSRVGHNIVRDIRNDVNSHLLTLSPGYFVGVSSGNLLSRITSDVVLVRTLLTDSVAAVIRDTIRIIALIAAAVYLDPFLALIAFVVFPIGIYPVYLFGRKVRRLSKRGQEAIGSLSTLMQESVVGNRVVRTFGREDYEKEKFEKENQSLTRTFIRSDRARALSGPVNEILGSFAVAAIIVYGGYSVMNGVRTQGEFIAFITAVFLLYDPFKKLSKLNSAVQQGLSGAERIIEVLDTEPKIKDPENPLPIPTENSIGLHGVCFSYKEGEPVLVGIDLKVEEGQKVALVGFSGAGKTTLVDLIPRFIDPVEGMVSIGGVDVSKVSLSDLRKKIAVVGQHTFLFNDTIYNNIAYGKPDATREEVLEAAKTAYAYDFIMQFPDGFEAMVGEGGLSLSGGERQRLAIARAVLKDAPILILDEATASLDNRAENEVQSALAALERDRTSLIIAHRLSTVRDVDKIVVMREGQIVEIGSHENLLDNGGEYQKLYELQFAKPKAAAVG